ncbi:MAG TPA: cation-translocating P-type ATPase [Bacteroidia bacterium]|nr:cation-translocating P-type ATPase [Bacteroidia bacterium]
MNNSSQTVLEIEGMDCSSCALSIEKKLNERGLKNVSVSFPNAEAVFTNDANLSLNSIINDIESLGYKVLLDNHQDDKRWFKTIAGRFYLTLPFSATLLLHMIFPESILSNNWVQLFLCLPVFIIGWFSFGKSSIASTINGTPNMDVLILLGSSAAFAYSLIGMFIMPNSHHMLFFETTSTIITLVLLGNLIEQRTVQQTTTAIKDLAQLQPQTAKKVYLFLGEEKSEEINFKEIKPGDILLVNTGDKIPADGEIIWGQGTVNESMITGENIPIEHTISSKVLAGTILEQGTFKMRVTKSNDDSALAHIIGLVKEAQRNKPEIQRLGDRVSSIFVPTVVIISVVTFLITYFVLEKTFSNSLINAIAVLVISCPCAMGLATPTAVMAGLGRASKNGMLIKGATTMETLSKAKVVFFDKTGTLTKGNFVIEGLKLFSEISVQEVKDVVFSMESHSSHPIAKALSSNLKNETKPKKLTEVIEHKGLGLEAFDELGNTYILGSKKFLEEQKIEIDEINYDIYLCLNNKLIAAFRIIDGVKDDAKLLIKKLKELHIEVVMLSGDKREKCDAVAAALDIKKVYSEQLPNQKLEILKSYGAQQITVMVGDGINDAPALSAAHVGISLSSASEAAINAAQIVLIKPQQMMDVFEVIKLSKATMQTIKQNLFWAFLYNIIAIPIAAAGFLSPIIGALSMAFSDVIVVGNSIRLKFRKV